MSDNMCSEQKNNGNDLDSIYIQSISSKMQLKQKMQVIFFSYQI